MVLDLVPLVTFYFADGVRSRVTLYNFLAREGQTKVIHQYGITACYVERVTKT